MSAAKGAAAAIEARLTTFDATMIVVSLVVGIGIFRTPSLVAAGTGTPALFLTAWVVGGAVTVLGALTFAEIGSRFPRPGAYYAVVAECYHPALAFMLNWAGVLMQGAGAAGVAFVGAEHVVPLILPHSLQGAAAVEAAAILLMSVLFGLNYLGIKMGARTQNVLTLLKIGMIAAVGAAAFARVPAVAPPEASTGAGVAGIGGLASALVAVFYTYGGYQNTINLGGDLRNARRSLPLAVLMGTAIVVLVYVGINAAYLRALGVEGIAGARLVAAETARACFGPAGHAVVSVAIFLSAAGFVNATILQVPRAYYAMAEDGVLPAIFRRIRPRAQVQDAGLALFGATMLLPALFLGSFERLLSYVMFTDGLSLAIVASAVFALRRRGIGAGGVFAMPGYPILPALFVLFLLGVASRVAFTDPSLAAAGLGVMAAGLGIFFLVKRAGGAHPRVLGRRPYG